MAVESDVVWQAFSGNGTTTSFAFTIPVQEPGDLIVQYQASPSTAPVQYQASNNFTVTLAAGDPSSGGTISGFQPGGAPPVSGSIVTVIRDFTPLQSTVIDNQGGFEPTVVTDALDRLTMMDQGLLDAVLRAISVPVGDAATGSMVVGPPEVRAGLVVGFDSLGNLTLYAPGGSGGGTVTLPANAILLGTNSSGQAYAVALGSGLSSSGGTLSASQLTVPASAPLLSTTSSQTIQGVQIGTGLAISSGTLSNTGNALPANAALLATSSGGSATAVSLGSGISISSGTLTVAGASVPINAAVLASNSGGTIVGLVLGTGLSSSGGTLTATAAGLPPSAAVLGSNSSSQAVALTLGSGLALSAGTLTATAATIPTNAAVLASNSGATVTALALGAGLTSSGGTLSATAAAVPANAKLLGSNSGSTLTSIALGAGLSETSGTLSVTGATLPISAALLATNSGGTATAVVLGSGLSSSGGTLAAAASAVPASAPLLGSTSGGSLQAISVGANLSLSGTNLIGTGAPSLPASAALLGSTSSSNPTAVVVGTGLTLSAGTLTASGSGLPASAPVIASNSGGTAISLALGPNLLSSGGTLSVSVPASEPLLGSTVGGSFSGVALGTNLSISSGTLNATGGGSSLPASAALLGSNSGGTGTAVSVGSGLAISGGTLSSTGTSGGGPYLPLGSGQIFSKQHNVYLKNQTVSGGGTQTLCSVSGTTPGVMTKLFLAVEGDANANNYSTVQIYKDGEGTPSVTLPLSVGMMNCGDPKFFTEYIGRSGGETTSGGYLYIYAPFNSSIVVEFVNASSSTGTIWSQVQYDLGGTYSWGDYGHLRNFTQGNTAYPPTVAVGPYVEQNLVNYSGGPGVLHGVSMVLDLPDNGPLEGLIQVYVDGETTASWQSSGTEDYFGGCFYFQGGLFASAYNGLTWSNNYATGYAAYRFHIPDPIKFNSSLRVTWTNGYNAAGVPSTSGTAYIASNVWFYTAS